MTKLFYISALLVLVASCKKPEDRSCWKGHGDETTLEIPLDSVHSFYLGKRIKYRFFEDNERKVVIRGGENMVKKVNLEYDNYDLTINNLNKCHFLRDHERKIEMDIHYPEYRYMYLTVSDSAVFMDTIHSDTLVIEMKEAGGEMVLNVENFRTEVVVSIGTANYVLSGHAVLGAVKVQDKGFADASNFTADKLFGFQNSTSDLYLNLEGSQAEIIINGTGDVICKGVPDTLIQSGVGSGKLIQQ
jgi:hypothetical protein